MRSVRHAPRRRPGPVATPTRIRRRRLFRGTEDRQRGAALIEGAMVAPIFFLLILGMLDGAWAIFGNNVLQGTASAGVRTVSALANDSDADYQALLQIKKSISGLGSQRLIRVVVYRANGFGDPPTAACKGGTSYAGDPTTRANACNVYDNGDLDLGAASFGCDPTSPDRFWCPSARRTSIQGANSPPDYIGVWVQAKHSSLTGVVVRMERTISDHSVLRIEPRTK